MPDLFYYLILVAGMVTVFNLEPLPAAMIISSMGAIITLVKRDYAKEKI